MLDRWNEGVGDLLVHRDSTEILDRFLFHLSRCVAFDQWYAAVFHRQDPPKRLGSHGLRRGRDDYEDGFYLLDPFYDAYRNSDAPSVKRLSDIARPNAANSLYFQSYLRKWDTSDEIGYIVPAAGNRCMHFSVSRSHDMSSFRRQEIEFLSSIINVVGVVFEIYTRATANRNAFSHHSLHEILHRKIDEFGRPVLTVREQEVVGYLIKGFAAQGIAELVDISLGTTKNHIKSVYRKLGVGSQVDLLVRFIDELYE